MQHRLQQTGRLFPADAQPTEVLQPADGTLDHPAPFVAAHQAPISGDILRAAIGPVRGDQFNAAGGEIGIKHIAVVGFFSDDALGRRGSGQEVETFLDQFAPMRPGLDAVGRYGQTASIDQELNCHSAPGLGGADAISTGAGLAEGRVDKALVEFEPARCSTHWPASRMTWSKEPALADRRNQSCAAPFGPNSRGKSIHFASLARIQKMPLSNQRLSADRQSPLGLRGVSEMRSHIQSSYSSVS